MDTIVAYSSFSNVSYSRIVDDSTLVKTKYFDCTKPVCRVAIQGDPGSGKTTARDDYVQPDGGMDWEAWHDKTLVHVNTSITDKVLV